MPESMQDWSLGFLAADAFYGITETTEHVESFQPGEAYEVTECVLPSSYYYVLEHALGISKNFKNAERLKTTTGTVVDTRKTSRFDFVILEFDE